MAVACGALWMPMRKGDRGQSGGVFVGGAVPMLGVSGHRRWRCRSAFASLTVRAGHGYRRAEPQGVHGCVDACLQQGNGGNVPEGTQCHLPPLLAVTTLLLRQYQLVSGQGLVVGG